MKGTTNVSEPRLPRPDDATCEVGMMRGAVLAAALIIGSASPVADATPAPAVHATLMPLLFAAKTDPIMSSPRQFYRGKFYRASQLAFQRCILHRESRGHWFSTNRRAGYFGGFQVTPALARGVTWMMLPELQHDHGKRVGSQIAKRLRATEMHHWLPVYQQQAFSTILNWRGDWSGAKHWGGKARCAS